MKQMSPYKIVAILERKAKNGENVVPSLLKVWDRLTIGQIYAILSLYLPKNHQAENEQLVSIIIATFWNYPKLFDLIGLFPGLDLISAFFQLRILGVRWRDFFRYFHLNAHSVSERIKNSLYPEDNELSSFLEEQKEEGQKRKREEEEKKEEQKEEEKRKRKREEDQEEEEQKEELILELFPQICARLSS